MSDLEKAARQALDALEDLVSTLDDDRTFMTSALSAITALRAALAQQAEPVGPWYRQFCRCPKCNEGPKQTEPVVEPVALTVAQQLRQLTDKFADEWNVSDIETLSMAAYILEQAEPVAEPVESSAERTLSLLGYTNEGGEYWKPPLGKRNQTERVLKEVDPITGITFIATLKFDPEPVQGGLTDFEIRAWKMGYDAAKAEQAEPTEGNPSY